MSFDRDEYDRFVANSPHRSIYCYSWWLDAVAPGAWGVALVRSSTGIQAALPYVSRKKWGTERIAQPDLSPMLGVLTGPPQGRAFNLLSTQKELMKALISQLQKVDSIDINLHYSLTNWLPFYWSGFSQTTAYTYLLKDLSESELWENLKRSVRTDIRKALKLVTVQTERPFEDFIEVYKATFARQNLQTPVSLDVIRRLEETCSQRNCRKILYACDAEGRIHGVAYFVWDDRSVYYLFGGGDPTLRSSGAQYLLLWEGILLAVRANKIFDFEGSMVESIESVFRAFGAQQAPIMKVYKKNFKYKLFEMASGMKRRVFR